MENYINILVIDDDKISQKFVGRALDDEKFRVDYADNGEQGLEKAIENAPDIIILDVEMPGLNGYEVCEKLHSLEQTKNTPVVFLSSHSSLRERMLGYEVGADDYLVKPFEKENLAAKISILSRYQEEQNLLKAQFEQAKKTAYIAMTGSNELGIAMQFVEKSYYFRNYSDLADALLRLCQQYHLNCTIMIEDNGQYHWFSIDEAIKPLEKEMIEMVDRNQRFVDFGCRTIVNFPNLCLLVKNMPLDDMERYGRMKDLLPMLLAAVDSKLNTMKAEQALNSQSDELIQSFGQIRNRLFYLAQALINNQTKSDQVLQSMVTEMQSDLLRMGLEEDQENYLLHRIDTAIAEAAEQIDASSIMHHVFTGILTHLKEVTAKQKGLEKTFIEMNTAPEKKKEVEDDGVELF